eukprot:11663903-Prorocentrum_lima.AAC.1
MAPRTAGLYAQGIYPQRVEHQFGFEASPPLGPSERSDPMKHKKNVPLLDISPGIAVRIGTWGPGAQDQWMN